MPITQRKPGAGLVHHETLGSHYTSQGNFAGLKEAEIQVSMSKKVIVMITRSWNHSLEH